MAEENAGGVYVELKLQMDDFKQQMEQSVSELEKQLKKMQDEADRSTNEVKNSFLNMSDGMKKAGSMLSLTVTTPLLGIGAAAIKTAGNFETAMAEVKGISGATGTEFEALSNKAREMGELTAFSATQAANGLKYMALASWDTEQMLEGLPAVLNLAIGASMDLAKASDIVTDTMTPFKLAATEATRVTDVFAKAQSNANIDVAMIGESMKFAAGSANSFNMSIEETVAALGLIGNAGIKGSMGGTSFNALLRDMKASAEGCNIAIGDTTVAIADATTGAYRNFIDIMEDIEKATKSMSASQRDNALSQIFGDESLKGVTAILSQGVDSLRTFTDELYNAEGASKELADTMTDTFEGKVNNFKSKLEEVGIVIGEELIPKATEVLECVGDLAEAFGNLDEDAQNTIITIGLVSASIGPLIKLVQGLGTAVAGAKAAGALLGSHPGIVALTVAAIATERLTRDFWGISEDVKVAKENMDAYNDVLETTKKLSSGDMAPKDIVTIDVDRVRELVAILDDYEIKIQEVLNAMNSGEEQDVSAPNNLLVFDELSAESQKYLEELNKITGSYEAAINLLNELDKKNKELANSQDGVSDALGETNDSLATQTKSLKELQTLFKSSTSTIQAYNKYLAEMSSVEGLSAKSKSEIANNYPELLGYLNDDIALRDKLNELITKEGTIQADTYNQILDVTSQYGNKKLTTYKNLYEEMSKIYGDDVKNFETIQSAKITINERIANTIGNAWINNTSGQQAKLEQSIAKSKSEIESLYDIYGDGASGQIDRIQNEVTQMEEALRLIKAESKDIQIELTPINFSPIETSSGTNTALQNALDEYQYKVNMDMFSSVEEQIQALIDIQNKYAKTIEENRDIEVDIYNLRKQQNQQLYDDLQKQITISKATDKTFGIEREIESYRNLAAQLETTSDLYVDVNLKILELQQDLYESNYDNLVSNFNHQKAMGEKSLQQEIEFYTQLSELYKDDVEKFNSALEKKYSLEQQLVQEQEKAYETAYNSRISNYNHQKNMGELSLDEEMNFWNEIAGLYKDDIDKYNNALEQKYKLQQQSITNQKNDLKKSYEAQKKEDQEYYESRKEALKDSYESQKESTTSYYDSQIKALEDYKNSITQAATSEDNAYDLEKLQKLYDAYKGSSTSEGQAKAEELRRQIRDIQNDEIIQGLDEQISNLQASKETALDNLEEQYNESVKSLEKLQERSAEVLENNYNKQVEILENSATNFESVQTKMSEDIATTTDKQSEELNKFVENVESVQAKVETSVEEALNNLVQSFKDSLDSISSYVSEIESKINSGYDKAINALDSIQTSPISIVSSYSNSGSSSAGNTSSGINNSNNFYNNNYFNDDVDIDTVNKLQANEIVNKLKYSL